MILNVNPKWRIVSDTEQWIVQRSGKQKGETVWKGVRWFDTPSAATWWLVGRQVREIPGEYPCAYARPEYPHYTTSIDAALTLVPEGWGYEISALPGEKVLVRPVKPCPDGSIETMSSWHSHATSAALAICAAALKARKEE